VDGRYDEIKTMADGAWGITSELYRMNGKMKTILSLTSNPCGAENKALRRISLPPTADRSGEMPHKRKNIA